VGEDVVTGGRDAVIETHRCRRVVAVGHDDPPFRWPASPHAEHTSSGRASTDRDMTSRDKLAEFGLQIALGVAVAALILVLIRGVSVPPVVSSVSPDRTGWIVFGVLIVGSLVAGYFAQDKFSLYVASMFLLLSVATVYLVAELLNFGDLGGISWAIIILVSIVGAVRIYFQRQL
jgi:hypothetical protein